MVTQPEVSGEATFTPPHRSSSMWRFWRRFSRNKLAVAGAAFVLVVVLLAILAPWISPYSYQTANFAITYQPPSWHHLLGTDALGRDMFTRVVWGLRTAVIIGFGAEVVELTLGMLLGATAGYLGGKVDMVLMRIVDVVFAFPSFFFAVIMTVVFGRNLLAILISISLVSWAGMARIARSQVIKIKQMGYIESAKGMGASSWTVIRRYILPNSMGPIVVTITFGIPTNMMAEAGLNVVGLGLEPPMPDLGAMISESQQAVFSYPYLLWGPAIVFGLILLSFVILGDGMRDAFDVKSGR